MFGVKTRSYITECTLMKLTTARRLKYEVHREEHVIVMDNRVRHDAVYDDLDALSRASMTFVLLGT